MNMMRKNNNNQNRNNMKHRGGQGGQRRYQNNGGGGNRGANDSGNLQRQKHHATQMLGKYNDMARNAQSNGDRVDVEYYLQHVDHYTRVLTDIGAIEAERYAHQRAEQIVPGGPNDPNAQEFHQQQAVANESGEANTASEGGNEGSAEGGNAGGGSGEFDNQRQPRMTRQRRPHHSDNGAKEANSNTSEIPLPDNILPPV